MIGEIPDSDDSGDSTAMNNRLPRRPGQTRLIIPRDTYPNNLLLDRIGHLKLSAFELCKSLDCNNFAALDNPYGFNTNNSRRLLPQIQTKPTLLARSHLPEPPTQHRCMPLSTVCSAPLFKPRSSSCFSIIFRDTRNG